MSEFNPPPPPAAAPVQPDSYQESSGTWLTRPILFGLSIPWLVGVIAVVIVAAWYVFAPEPASNVNRLAFGAADLQMTSAPTGSLSFGPATSAPVHPAGLQTTPDTNLAQIQDQVAAMVAGVRSHSEANREAIERLAETTKAVMANQAALKQQVAELQAQVALASAHAAPVPPASAARPVVPKTKADRSSTPLTGMHLSSVQNGMAWVFWQDKTWAVQVGDPLGPVTITGIDAQARQVRTTAGILE